MTEAANDGQETGPDLARDPMPRAGLDASSDTGSNSLNPETTGTDYGVDPESVLLVYGLCMIVPARREWLDLSQWADNRLALIKLNASDSNGKVAQLLQLATESLSSAPHTSSAPAARLAHDRPTHEGAAIDRAHANGLGDELDPQLRPHQLLSERELQVAVLMSQGNTVGEISKMLSLSVKTISTYRVRALKKMNLKTTADLIRYMIQNQIG